MSDFAIWAVMVLVLMAVLAVTVIVLVRALGTLRESTAQAPPFPRGRHLPVLAPICGNCRHFDLEAGQARMRRNPVFQGMVAPYIAPSEYAEEVDPETDRVIETKVPEACEWSQFGLCERHDEGVWKRMTPEQRTKNFADWTIDGDCYEPKLILEPGDLS